MAAPYKADLIAGLRLVEHSLYKDADGTRICVETWAGQAGQAHLEIDSTRKQYRWVGGEPSSTGTWETYQD